MYIKNVLEDASIDWIWKNTFNQISYSDMYEHQASRVLATAIVLEYIKQYEISQTLRLQNIFHNRVLKY